MMSTKTLISILFAVFLTQSLLAQENPLKDYAESRRDRKFCLYPSTLRMINISQNEDYSQMVSGIEKLLIYKLDSTASADKSYKEMFSAYTDLGYEEYISMYGGGQIMYLYGIEHRNENEFVGVFSNNDMALAIYLRGNIGWNKIPDLIDSMQEDEMLNILDFNTDAFENNPHD